ncbi:hypothetical protein D9M72_200270 [compost metagenome]
MNTKPKCTSGIPIAPQATYKVGGRLLSGTQLAQAVEACIGISQSYALADVKNGGSERIHWEGLDQVAEKADKALGEHLQEVNDWAKRENGFRSEAVAAAANDDHVGAAERKKSDDTEGGSLD